ncbi:MAG TPA: phosphotransferase [Terriglobales bacterium]|jgi:aminoglycoside phosphotransferase
MHELILDLLDQAPAHVITRIPLDQGALIACFDTPGRAGVGAQAGAPQPPRWIAKTATTPAAILRLQAEAQALGYLEPWSQTLRIPRILGWQESDHECCLVQSGALGLPQPCRWDLRRPWAALPLTLTQAADWLAYFQQLVPARRPVPLAELAGAMRRKLRENAARDQEAAKLLLELCAIIPSHSPDLMSVACHGDFWRGNVLFTSGSKLPSLTGVIDWSGFTGSTALDDLLTWMATLTPRAPRSRLELWLALFFRPGRPRDFLRQWASRHGYDDRAARLAFLVFLARRMQWELGLDLQARDAAERASALGDWAELLAWMAQHNYADPFTPLPCR